MTCDFCTSPGGQGNVEWAQVHCIYEQAHCIYEPLVARVHKLIKNKRIAYDNLIGIACVCIDFFVFDFKLHQNRQVRFDFCLCLLLK